MLCFLNSTVQQTDRNPLEMATMPTAIAIVMSVQCDDKFKCVIICQSKDQLSMDNSQPT